MVSRSLPVVFLVSHDFEPVAEKELFFLQIDEFV